MKKFRGEFEIIDAKTPGDKPYKWMDLPYYLGTKIPEYLGYFLKNH